MPEIEDELLIDCGNGRVRKLNPRTLIEEMADDFGDRHWSDGEEDSDDH